MDYSKDLLEKIQEFARKLTPISEMGALLDLDERILKDDINTIGNPARAAFYKGYAETALKARERNLDLAEAGSPSAEDAIEHYISRMMNEL